MTPTLPRPTVQSASPADLDAIAAIEAKSGHWSRAQLAEEIERGNALVARLDGHVAGFAVGWLVADEVHVMEVATAPSMRRRGVGRALMRALLAQSDGPALLEVRASNAPAIALYEGLGFVAVGRRPRYYRDGEDAVLMTRPEAPREETR